ncbi:MAG: serine hydrolase domain-containing protein [Acidobacteriota bacterium]|nr:serine hydrolase domain-containing protein [Acidobacteriota bacterium]
MEPGVAMAGGRARAIESFLRSQVDAGTVSTAAAAVARVGVRAAAASWPRHVGHRQLLFDAASLTKPFVATLALQLHRAQLLSLDTRVGELWERCSPDLARHRLEDLLRHRSGLAAWAPLYRRCRRRSRVTRLLQGGSLSSAGAAELYSDLGYIAWGLLAETATGQSLSRLFDRFVAQPLCLGPLELTPGRRSDVAACACDNGQEVAIARAMGIRVAAGPPVRWGEPQDGNARFLGDLPGHAGLFVSLDAALGLGRAWLRSLSGRGPLDRDLTRRALAGRGEYALGWARRRGRGSAGPGLSTSAFGHIGFTGTSLWMDPANRAVLVLLAHRTDPLYDLLPMRRRFHQLGNSLLAS